jgi:acetyl-CoA C-acetyltransferase
LFDAATAASAGVSSIGVDDIDVFDLYSCFPSAVELALDALGIATGDRRALSVTGGLPYFGGPGNNYTTHAIGTVTDILRGSAHGLGLVSGLGWFITKHALGVYGTDPPLHGYRQADTSAAQSVIDDSAQPVALEVDRPTPATVVAVTVVRDKFGTATGAPLIARLPDGRQMALSAADDDVVSEVGHLDVPGLVDTGVVVQSGAARYRLPLGRDHQGGRHVRNTP